MHPFICSSFSNNYIVANRFRHTGAIIDTSIRNELIRLSDLEIAQLPNPILSLFTKLGLEKVDTRRVKDVLIIRSPSVFQFRRASYEITERCNYHCSHCYLGNKSTQALQSEEKKDVLRLIELSGCLWLQLTGGEPLVVKDFQEIYSFAYSLGFLITLSTNGSLISEPDVIETLSRLPPFRITISLYGATAAIYEGMTSSPGSFSKLLTGLQLIKEKRINARINIILTTHNAHERNEMINLARKLGFEYHVFSRFSPTLDGNAQPLSLMADNCSMNQKQPAAISTSHSGCFAGKTFFHVNAQGQASICKVARVPWVDLLNEGLSGLEKLPVIASKLLEKTAACNACAKNISCPTCAPRLKLYQLSGIVPPFICQKTDH